MGLLHNSLAAPKAIKAATVLAAAAALLVAGCGSAASQPAQHTTPAAAASSAPAVTCSGLSGVISTLVGDQRSQDKTLEENWVNVVNGSLTSQGQDLQAGISATAQASTSSAASQLTTDAQSFHNDASTFLSDQSGGLMPGWPSEDDTVKADIKRLAADCGIAHKGV